jgi:DNA-binding CsgD family transcriptional regulator
MNNNKTLNIIKYYHDIDTDVKLADFLEIARKTIWDYRGNKRNISKVSQLYAEMIENRVSLGNYRFIINGHIFVLNRVDRILTKNDKSFKIRKLEVDILETIVKNKWLSVRKFATQNNKSRYTILNYIKKLNVKTNMFNIDKDEVISFIRSE